MNARRAARAARQFAAALLLAASCGVGAAGVLDDPLQTRPATLQDAVDEAGAACPAPVDLQAPLTPQAAADVALCNNARLRESWAAIKFQAAALGQARAAYLPTLQGTLGRLDTRTRGGNAQAASTLGTTSDVEFSWRLFDFGAREANESAADHELAAALRSREALLSATLLAVVQAYYAAATAQSAVATAEQDAAVARATLESASRRSRRGSAAESDVLQAQTALAKAALAQRRAEGARDKALSVLAYAMGLPAQARPVLADVQEDVDAQRLQELDEGLDALLARVRERHPAIAAAREQLAAARERVAAAQAAGLPTIDLSIDRYQNGYPGQGLSPTRSVVRTVGVMLTIPLFDGFAGRYRVASARATVEQDQSTLLDVEQQTLGDIVRAHADARAALGGLRESRDLLDSAERALAAAQRRYERGAGDIVELLATEQALADARQERLRTLSDWRAARLHLLVGLGRDGL
jgi:outer membrane protein